MTCRELSGFLLEYVSGELPAALAVEFEVHLGACADCAVFVEQYRQSIALGRAVLTGASDPDVPDELVRAILASIKEERT